MRRSPEGDAAVAADLAEFSRGRGFSQSVTPEEVQEALKFRVKTRREQSFNWFWRWVRLQIGYSHDRAEHADKTNALFAAEVSERRQQQQQIDELTDLCTFLAREVAALRNLNPGHSDVSH